MALAVVQAVQANNSSGTSATTGGITTTSGNLLVAIAGGWRSGSPQTHTITDSNTNTWTEVTGSPQDPTTNTRVHMFYAKNISGGASHTFTTTTGATCTGMTVIVMEISGADTVAPYDTGAATKSSGTAPSSGATGTRAQANEIIVGGVGTGDNVNNGTMTAGSGFTIPTNGSQIAFANYVSAIEYQIVSATGTDAATFTISSDFWGCIAATFKAAAGSLPPQSKFGKQAIIRASYY